jgi:hypothetical protein
MLAGYAPAPTPPPGSLSATPAPTTEAGYSINPAEETFCGVHCFSQGGGKAGDAGDAGAAAEDWGSRVENPKVGAQRVQGASGMHPLVCPFSSPLGNRVSGKRHLESRPQAAARLVLGVTSSRGLLGWRRAAAGNRNAWPGVELSPLTVAAWLSWAAAVSLPTSHPTLHVPSGGCSGQRACEHLGTPPAATAARSIVALRRRRDAGKHLTGCTLTRGEGCGRVQRPPRLRGGWRRRA